LQATSGSMWIYFHSDSLLEYRGFLAKYTYIPNRVIQRKCSETFKNANNNITDTDDCHFFPQPSSDGIIDTEQMKFFYKHFTNHQSSSLLTPPTHIECVWTLQAEQHMQMRFFVDEFMLGMPNECSENFMEIYAGTTAGKPMKKFVFCFYFFEYYLFLDFVA
jgi:hypothetical protein